MWLDDGEGVSNYFGACFDQFALIFLSRLGLGEWLALTQWVTAQGKATMLCTCSLLFHGKH